MSDSSSEVPHKKDTDSINGSCDNKLACADRRSERVDNKSTPSDKSPNRTLQLATSSTTASQSPSETVVDITAHSVSATAVAATGTTEAQLAASLPPPPALEPAPATSPASTAAVPTDSGEMAQNQSQQQQKRQFLVFIKILFKILDQNHDVTVEKREAARAIVADCTRRNRLGDPAFIPLMAAVDARLRRHLGEQHWRKAHIYMRHYMNREAARTRLPLPVGSKTAAV